MRITNIFADIPPPAKDEFFETVHQHPNVSIERIVSHGHASLDNFWYDQDTYEWVMLLKGHAQLPFEREAAPVELTAGDHVVIPADKKHRVQWTDPDEDTIWLPIHF